MKNPGKLVTIADNMEKVKNSGFMDQISGTVKTPGTITQRDHRLYSVCKTVSDKVKNVYESGKRSAEELKTTIYSMGEAMLLTDVNSIEHDVVFDVSNNSPEDVDGIEITRYGKNLLSGDVHDFSKWTTDNGQQKRFYFDNLIVGKTYTFSFDTIAALDQYGYFYFRKLNKETGEVSTHCNFAMTGKILTNDWTFTVESGYKYYLYGWFQYNTSAGMLENNMFKAISNFQLELGSKPTGYEDYIEPVSITRTNSDIMTLRSISPNMTLVHNKPGALVIVDYYKQA